MAPAPTTLGYGNRTVWIFNGYPGTRSKLIRVPGRQFITFLTPLLSTSGLPSNSWFLGPIQAHNPNGISIGLAVFAQMTAECPYTLQWDALPPLKIAPSSFNTWFPGPTRVLNPDGISISVAVFAGLTKCDRQKDRHTDRPRYSVGNSRPHLHM